MLWQALASSGEVRWCSLSPRFLTGDLQSRRLLSFTPAGDTPADDEVRKPPPNRALILLTFCVFPDAQAAAVLKQFFTSLASQLERALSDINRVCDAEDKEAKTIDASGETKSGAAGAAAGGAELKSSPLAGAGAGAGPVSTEMTDRRLTTLLRFASCEVCQRQPTSFGLTGCSCAHVRLGCLVCTRAVCVPARAGVPAGRRRARAAVPRGLCRQPAPRPRQAAGLARLQQRHGNARKPLEACLHACTNRAASPVCFIPSTLL